MGMFFSNFHVRRTKELSMEGFLKSLTETVKKQRYSSVEASDKADISVSVFDAQGSWISVCSDGFEFDSDDAFRGICEPLSRLFSTEVMTISCYDSDCLLLHLVNSINGTDAWAKIGRYPGIGKRSTPAKWKGHVSDLSRWKELLKKEYGFAEESLQEIEPALGLVREQGCFTFDMASEKPYAGKTSTLYFALPETAQKPEPPRLKITRYSLDICEMDKDKMISVYNEGGKSTGLAIAFSGPYVENEEIRFRNVRLEYDYEKHPRPTIPLSLEKKKTSGGMWIYYAEIPDFRIPPRVKEGLSPQKEDKERFKREFGVRFTPEGNTRKRLDITVWLIPLKNFEKGQCGWCVWWHSGSKEAFIRSHNNQMMDLIKRCEKMKVKGPAVNLLNTEDFDMD